MLDFKFKKSMPELTALAALNQNKMLNNLLKEIVIEKAKEIDPAMGIEAVCLGVCPDDPKTPSFYFLAPGRVNFQLLELIADIDFEIAQESDQVIGFCYWPISISQKDKYQFLGEIIYSVQK